MDDLRFAIGTIVNRDSSKSRINPSWIANEAMLILDPERISIPAVYHGCALHARQLAREMLRDRYASEDESSQDSLFSDYSDLQPRYPMKHDGKSEPEYVLLNDMTDEDILYNVERLRLEAKAKMKHADALEEFGRKRARGAA